MRIEIADALTTAHRHGIVHRDLKPSNIILTKARREAARLRPRQARRAGRSTGGGSPQPTTPPGLTAQGTILGTFQYMAPEQLEGKDADARTDIFAFGAVVYEMLTGKKAFEGRSQASLIGAIMHAEPPAIAAVQPLTPPALDRIVKTCLAKDPDDRWQTARDLSRELSGSVTSRPRRRHATTWARETCTSCCSRRSCHCCARQVTRPGRSNRRHPGGGCHTFQLHSSRRRALHSDRAASLLPCLPTAHASCSSRNNQLYLRNMADEEFHPITGTGQDVRSRRSSRPMADGWRFGARPVTVVKGRSRRSR